MAEYDVVAAAGSFRSADAVAVRFPHRWTPEGVTVEAPFTGAHLLNLAVAGCVLNDVYREAGPLGIEVRGVRVRASGGFDDAWRSTGIRYVFEIDTDASPALVSQLLGRVDEVAEIPQALRAGADVGREEVTA
jgi:hypothetical protein